MSLNVQSAYDLNGYGFYELQHKIESLLRERADLKSDDGLAIKKEKHIMMKINQYQIAQEKLVGDFYN